jgi:hypothetical protein
LHICGHKEAHAVPGPAWKKERELKRLSELECTDCWGTKKTEEWEFLANLHDVPRLTGEPVPELTGTTKRQGWARSIRAQMLFKLRLELAQLDRERKSKDLPPAEDGFLAAALKPMFAHKSSSWWIDHRDTPPLDILDFGGQDAFEAIRQETLSAPDPSPCPF